MATNVTLTINNASTNHVLTTGGRGPVGASGAPGSDASVTQANVEAAITDDAAFRTSIGAAPTTHTHPVGDITPVSGTHLIGRHAGGSGAAQEVSVGNGLEFQGSGIRRSALTGDVTAPAGSNATTIANNTVTNAKLAHMATATIKGRATAGTGDPEDLTAAQARTVLGAETTEIRWLERFGRHADAASIGTGSTTERGNTWFMSNQSGFSSAVISNEALIPRLGDLYYIGGSVPCPGKRFSLSVVAELRNNPDYNGSGTTDAGIILSNGPIAFAGLGSYLASGVTHCQFYAANPAMVSNPFYDTDFPGGAPAFTTDGDVTNQLPIVGKKLLINMSVRDDVLTATMAGQTKVYRSAAFSQTMTESGTGFFVEAGNPVTQRYIWAIHAIWVNSPVLDNTAFVATQTQADLDFFRRDAHLLPGVMRLFDGTAGFTAGTLPTVKVHAGGSGTTAKGSNNRINGGNILADGGFVSSYGYTNSGKLCRAPMDFDLGLNAAVASIATTESTLISIGATPSLEDGDMEVYEFAGNLTGANAKRIRLFRSAGALTIFDTDLSGTPLTGVTGAWLLTVRRSVTPTASYMISQFTASGVSLIQRVAANFGNNSISLALLSTTTDAGGATLEFARQKLVRVNIN